MEHSFNLSVHNPIFLTLDHTSPPVSSQTHRGREARRTGWTNYAENAKTRHLGTQFSNR